ncbi:MULTISPECIES: malto-oligosyltrehalose trehalohydrolase [Cyanophyceae]|uniref:malto-oligosyltrehalose trehalohydrolase n=1 Tax=Cyanophyceae TaxID=3028117 RepID=UPI0016898170|nr:MULTISPECIES: malto-oligosyltrehalose trehalohydrolase [Cyanophyceae]MBD1917334.1 malto-oligosyltrehalose trehalohydrolase [Phormidium sp. FACHB-77]MBD2032257.1 malto-oligosyltrehalose trehalohydrolase [Phormidium sp. FACHB-322]MBD2053295.1 malto-oligosyltrehalose trehalohydrolase [Leptolyngbya sp. FACHB-60]
MRSDLKVGAILQDNGQCHFTLWGPELDSVELRLLSPKKASFPMQKSEEGYWTIWVDDVAEGTQYQYCINEADVRPDPASFYQPEGVHGPSAVVDLTTYKWGDEAWKNIPWSDYVIYELHVGTFTAEGTFDSAIAQLADLKALGITAVEILPVSQFPGERNWGYDGVFPYATQNSYGGPNGLKRLVDACHREGLAVILDVVYNHLGPEGNYTGSYGPYTTDKYTTPWGNAINFDDTWSDGVRHYCIQNALYWLGEFHIDGLRLDAIHAIYDFSAKHLLAEMAEAVAELSEQVGKPLYVTAESDLNDTRVIRPAEQGGHALRAQWSDDFHHALHTLITGERYGYYQDFGTCEALATAIRDRFVYSGTYSPFRHRRHGNSATNLPSDQFIVCAQNHDQIGNAKGCDRLTKLVPFDALKLTAGVLLTSPYIPLIFMGEEYGEEAPFNYFIDHSDPDLIKAVFEGRKREFKEAHGFGEPAPAHEVATYEASKLNWHLRGEGKHKTLLNYYQRLLELRRQLQLNAPSYSKDMEISSDEDTKVIVYRRAIADGQLMCLMNFNQNVSVIDLASPQQPWVVTFDSAAAEWAGPGSSLPEKITEAQSLELPPLGFTLYTTT